MRLLHAITTGLTDAWIWAYVYGANGRMIGNDRGDTWERRYHLFPIHRATPPPMPPNDASDYQRERHFDRRRYWNPWNRFADNMDTEARLTPICGRLSSRSRSPRISPAGEPYDGTFPNACLDCQRIAEIRHINTTFVSRLVTQDPWMLQRRNSTFGWHMPDPVTGL